MTEWIIGSSEKFKNLNDQRRGVRRLPGRDVAEIGKANKTTVHLKPIQFLESFKFLTKKFSVWKRPVRPSGRTEYAVRLAQSLACVNINSCSKSAKIHVKCWRLFVVGRKKNSKN